MMKIKNIFLLPAATVMLLSSCAYNDMPEDGSGWLSGPRPLVISADISGSKATRATTNETGTADEWSYLDFTEGDVMGFFASGGKFTGDNYGEAPFENQELIYTGGTGGANFRDPNGVSFSPSHMNGNQIYMYYPYSTTITDAGGFVLRTLDAPGEEKVDTARCIDFLSTRHLDILDTTSDDKPALYGEFQHTFAELIIMRGEGFDNPPKISDDINEWEIKAVLNIPVTGIRAEVTTEGGWSCTPKLVYDEASGLDETQAREWQAWLGANFYRTQEDKIGQVAWYVIVPTIGCQAQYVAPRPGERTRVEYIELYDNDGNLQRVSSLLLSNGNSKYVDGGWRYPMEITMKELVPTANPCQIVPWNDDIDLTDERKRGINNATEFEGWVKAYNAYIDDDNDINTKALLKYGDLYINEDETKSWHFYVLSDMDLSGFETGKPIVPVLKDILDGQSTVFTNGRFQNHVITGLKSPLIGQLTGGEAMVQNFNFTNPYVTYGEDNATPLGIIANYMLDGATVNNCRIISGTLYNPAGPGGMVAGSIFNSSITGCTLSGFLISSSTVDNIVGQNNGGYNNQNNNASNVTNQDSDDD